MKEQPNATRSHSNRKNDRSSEPAPRSRLIHLNLKFGMACGNYVQLGVRYQLHVLCEPITTSGNGDDVLVVLRSLTQGFAQ